MSKTILLTAISAFFLASNAGYCQQHEKLKDITTCKSCGADLSNAIGKCMNDVTVPAEFGPCINTAVGVFTKCVEVNCTVS